jgi:hypothetical protein
MAPFERLVNRCPHRGPWRTGAAMAGLGHSRQPSLPDVGRARPSAAVRVARWLTAAARCATNIGRTRSGSEMCSPSATWRCSTRPITNRDGRMPVAAA